jgi:hypothetical protein
MKAIKLVNHNIKIFEMNEKPNKLLEPSPLFAKQRGEGGEFVREAEMRRVESSKN